LGKTNLNSVDSLSVILCCLDHVTNSKSCIFDGSNHLKNHLKKTKILLTLD